MSVASLTHPGVIRRPAASPGAVRRFVAALRVALTSEPHTLALNLDADLDFAMPDDDGASGAGEDTMTAIHTYADAWGVWHAVIPQHAYSRPADAARRAIRRELVAREAPTFDPRAIGVRLHEVRDGRMIYREARALR